MSEFLTFERRQPPGRKTAIVDVNSKSTGANLGRIAWYGPWRQFCFYPEPDTVFNGGCLEDVQQEILQLHRKRSTRGE